MQEESLGIFTKITPGVCCSVVLSLLPPEVCPEQDLYGSNFQYLHRRDLYLMVKVLRANAVMLEPWNAKERVDVRHGRLVDVGTQLKLLVLGKVY